MTRIAVVIQGDPGDPGAWSGIPHGIAAGLSEAGVEPVPVSAQVPGASKASRIGRMSWADQAASRPLAAASSLAAAARLRAAGPLNGVIALGSGYVVPRSLPSTTFDDMTVAQAVARADATYGALGEAAVARWRQRQRQIYLRSRGCCVASTWTMRSVRDDYGISEDRIHIVGFGHNHRPQRVDRDWSVPRFIFIGRDWDRKRGPAVVESFAAVRAVHTEATLDLVGKHPLVEGPGIRDHGEVPLGSTPGQALIQELLATATCLVVPSTYEPFGIAYLDAAGSGIPSIGTTVGGAPDAIGEGGMVVDPDDEGALTAAMLSVAAPGEARRLGRLAAERVSQFTWRAVAERLLRALHPSGVEIAGLAPFLEPFAPAV